MTLKSSQPRKTSEDHDIHCNFFHSFFLYSRLLTGAIALSFEFISTIRIVHRLTVDNACNIYCFRYSAGRFMEYCDAISAQREGGQVHSYIYIYIYIYRPVYCIAAVLSLCFLLLGSCCALQLDSCSLLAVLNII